MLKKRSTKKRKKHCLDKYPFLPLLSAMFLFIFVATAFSAMRKITIVDHLDQQNKVTYEILTESTRPKNMIKEAGLSLAENDEYRLHLDENTQSTTITIYRSVPVNVEFRGEITTYYTGKPTVGELVQKIGYEPKDYDIIPGAHANITKGMNIIVLEKKASLEEKRNEEHLRDGYIKTSRGSVRYQKHYVMEASAYLPTDGGGSGITASGIPAKRGIVAVDPAVIPLGTRLYIEGYGFALAADTGGMIEGHMIDLCMEDLKEALEFGRRNINVYVLEH